MFFKVKHTLTDSRTSRLNTSRTKRAGLTAISSLLQTGVGLLIGLLVTPLLVSGLGAEAYGGWLMLVQIVSYLSLVDFGNSTVMKVDLATQQHLDNVDMKQRQVGAAILALSLATPLFLAVAVGVVWWLPISIDFQIVSASQIRFAASLVALSLLINRFGSIFGHILFGVNLDYKSARMRTIVVAVTALMDVLMVRLGFGIIGLAFGKVVAATLLTLIMATTAWRNVTWFGVRWPQRNEFTRFFRRNSWYTFSHWGSILIELSDIALIGFLFGPSIAAAYSLTGAMLRMVATTFSSVLNSANPGLGDLFGRGELQALSQLRTQMEAAAIAFFGIAGSVFLVGNASFVALWVGPDLFAGHAVTLGVLLIWMLLVLTRYESGFLMGCLVIRSTTLVHLFSGLVGVFTGCFLSSQFGIIGLLVGYIFGRLTAITGNAVLFQRLLSESAIHVWANKLRLISVTAMLIVASYTLSTTLDFQNWLILGAICSGTALVACCVVWRVGLNSTMRSLFLSRSSHLLRTFIPVKGR